MEIQANQRGIEKQVDREHYKRAKNRVTKAFPYQNDRVTDEQYRFIQNLAVNLSEPNYKLFVHILLSSAAQFGERNGWVPISEEFRLKHFKGSNINKLASVLEKKAAKYFIERKSREFKLRDGLLEEFMSLGQPIAYTIEAIEELVDKPKWSAYKKKRINKPQKTSFYDENKNECSKLIREALEALTDAGGYIHLSAVVEHIKRLQEAINNKPAPPQALQKRFYNDSGCLNRIALQGLKPSAAPNIYRYEPYYEISSTGRIYGLAVSASREMKAAIYDGIPNCINYDLKASQGRILLEELEKAQIQCDWLVDYLQSPDARAAYAKEAGISEDLWKNIYYAIVMGANLPTTLKIEKFSQGSVAKYLREELPENEAEAALDRLREILAPLVKVTKKWHKHLIERYKNKTFVKNAVGCYKRIDLTNNNRYETLCEMAAHILQGKEAKFIHHLTRLGQEYGYLPIANEHDGLVVIGAIPEDAAKKAAELSSLKHHVLEPKKF